MHGVFCVVRRPSPSSAAPFPTTVSHARLQRRYKFGGKSPYDACQACWVGEEGAVHSPYVNKKKKKSFSATLWLRWYATLGSDTERTRAFFSSTLIALIFRRCNETSSSLAAAGSSRHEVMVGRGGGDSYSCVLDDRFAAPTYDEVGTRVGRVAPPQCPNLRPPPFTRSTNSSP